MQLRSFYSKKTNGDTLVEVLFSIAIVSAVIAGSYAMASRSLQQGVLAAQRTEAIKLAEGQIESLKLRQKPTNGSWNIFTAAQNFCLDTTNAVSQYTPAGTPNPEWLPQQNHASVDTDDPQKLIRGGNGYQDKCTTPVAPGAPRYFINVTTKPTGSNPTFLIAVRWQRPGGGPVGKAQFYYKFPPAVAFSVAPSPSPSPSPAGTPPPPPPPAAAGSIPADCQGVSMPGTLYHHFPRTGGDLGSRLASNFQNSWETRREILAFTLTPGLYDIWLYSWDHHHMEDIIKDGGQDNERWHVNLWVGSSFYRSTPLISDLPPASPTAPRIEGGMYLVEKVATNFPIGQTVNGISARHAEPLYNNVSGPESIRAVCASFTYKGSF